MPNIKQKLVISGCVVFMAAAAYSTTTYLPNNSNIGKERREHYLKTGELTSQFPESKVPKAGSMWKNMDKHIKEDDI